MSLSHCKDTQGKCRSVRVDILKRCGSYMWVLLYTIKRSLAKLNIKTECAAINLLTTRCLPSFSWTSLPGCMGKEVTPIYWGIRCAIFRALSFGWKIKFFGSIFKLVINFLVRFSWNTKLYLTFKVW